MSFKLLSDLKIMDLLKEVVESGKFWKIEGEIKQSYKIIDEPPKGQKLESGIVIINCFHKYKRKFSKEKILEICNKYNCDIFTTSENINIPSFQICLLFENKNNKYNLERITSNFKFEIALDSILESKKDFNKDIETLIENKWL